MKKIKYFNGILLFMFSTHSGAKHFDSIEDNMAFWAGQFKEHAEFCIDFTQELELKNEAKVIARNFDMLHADQRNKNEFIQLSSRIKKLQKKVRNSLSKKDQDYRIKKALIDHMTLETDYAVKKVKGKKLRNSEEIKFWADEHAGEAEAIAYFMIDNTPLQEEAERIEKELKDTTLEKLREVESANEKLEEIGAQLEVNPTKTRMPAKLAEHEKRERERAARILAELSDQ